MTRRLPLISFVVVTHDRPVELVTSRIIRTICEQDHPRLELVLIGEDCPHIGALTEIIARDFPDLRMRWKNLLRSEGLISPWSLVAKCRNVGISLARGEYISCQDDDNELAREFASSLLSCLLSSKAEAAWCYRWLVMPDGSPYPGTFFPWLDPCSIRERLIYEIWRAAGVIEVGSAIMRDKLVASNYAETFSTVDANEWLVRASIYKQFPFREKFGFHDLMGDTSFDDLWNRDIRFAGVRAVCSETVSLVYHLGGEGNRHLITKWLERNRVTDDVYLHSEDRPPCR
jgi:hypothetical protein